jgi:branched-subunit amino acid transport protein
MCAKIQMWIAVKIQRYNELKYRGKKILNHVIKHYLFFISICLRIIITLIKESKNKNKNHSLSNMTRK